MTESISDINRRIDSMHNNMALKSDVSQVQSQVNNFEVCLAKVDRLIDTVENLVIIAERREEGDKHREKDAERTANLIIELQKDNRYFRDYIASEKPINDARTWVFRGVISFIVLGVLTAAFVATK